MYYNLPEKKNYFVKNITIMVVMFILFTIVLYIGLSKEADRLQAVAEYNCEAYNACGSNGNKN